MLHVKSPVILAIWLAACFAVVTCTASARRTPCTLSYFDLWKDADVIFTSNVLGVGELSRSYRLKIYKILKHSTLKEGRFNITSQSIFDSLDAKSDLLCDGKFTIGETRVIFAALDESSGVRVLRVPKLRSWLLVLLESISAEGNFFCIFYSCITSKKNFFPWGLLFLSISHMLLLKNIHENFIPF